MKTRRKRITLAALMILVAIVAIAFRAVEYSRRTRFVLVNARATSIKEVTLRFAGRVEHLGPIAPKGQAEIDIPLPASEVLRASWTIQGASGKPDTKREAPGVSAPTVGGLITIQDSTP